MASSCLQICALLLALAGFTTLLVTTMSSRWKVLDTTTELVTAEWISEGLWMDCAASAVGSVQCKKFLYMLSSDPHIQACRALMITSILLGFLAAVLSLLGMKCTNIGLSDEDGKMKFTVTGGFLYILAGLCSMVAISWYAAMITAQFFNQLYAGTKLFQTRFCLIFRTNSLSMNFLDWTVGFPARYELGEALYLGWAGSVLYILGGILLTCSCRGKEKQNYSPNKYAYSAAQAASQPHMYPRNPETVISNKEYV